VGTEKKRCNKKTKSPSFCDLVVVSDARHGQKTHTHTHAHTRTHTRTHTHTHAHIHTQLTMIAPDSDQAATRTIPLRAFRRRCTRLASPGRCPSSVRRKSIRPTDVRSHSPFLRAILFFSQLCLHEPPNEPHHRTCPCAEICNLSLSSSNQGNLW